MKPLLLLLPAWLALAGTAAAQAPSLDYRLGVATHFARKSPITQHWDPQQVIPLIADLGVGWIRDEIVWPEVEAKKGEYAIPEKTREWIDLVHARGLHIVACFNGRNPLYDDNWDPQAYARAAAYVAAELKGKVQAIEVVNEPFEYYAKYYGQGVLAGGLWHGLEKDGSVSTWVWKYLALLNGAAEAIKAANPEMKVIGLGNPAPVNYRQIERGISPAVDGITDHPYSFRTVPEIVPVAATAEALKRDGFAVADKDGTFPSYVASYRAFSREHHGPSELWLTEWGFSTFREGAKRNVIYSGFTEEAQAKYALRRFLECLALGVELSVEYEFMDDLGKDGDSAFDPEQHFGLIRADRTPKPAYAAVRRLAHEMAGCVPDPALEVAVAPFSDRTEEHPVRWDGGLLPAPSRITAYAFRAAGGGSVVAVWSPERAGDLNPRAADVTIGADPRRFSVQALDLLTGETSVPDIAEKDGRIVLSRLAVPDHPVLLKLIPKP